MKMNSKGFTLIETVITTSLSTMILICMMSILMASIYGWSKGIARNTSTETATVAAQRLCNDIRDGKSASVSGGTLTVLFPTMITDSTTGESMYNLSSTYMVPRSYLLINTNLIRRVGETDTVIARNINRITFSVQGPSVSAVLRSADQSGRYTSTEEVSSKVLLRNYR
jgi:type II secretory pathway pseudopilin PulG